MQALQALRGCSVLGSARISDFNFMNVFIMYKNHGTNFAELHKRLYSVLPEYKPISAASGPGTYKSIDAAGVVWLVTLSVDDQGKQSRSTKRALSADEVEERADSARRHAPHEGWERNF